MASRNDNLIHLPCHARADFFVAVRVQLRGLSAQPESSLEPIEALIPEAELTTQRECMREIVAKWWTLMEDGH